MPLMAATDALALGTVIASDAVRERPWNYWYNTDTQEFFFVGHPGSPKSVMDR